MERKKYFWLETWVDELTEENLQGEDVDSCENKSQLLSKSAVFVCVCLMCVFV